jgi:hypothetical protein
MYLTRSKAIELHRELWDWLTKNPHRRKVDWPRWVDYGGPGVTKNECFLCEYSLPLAVDNENNAIFMCDYCPLVWPGGSCEHKEGNKGLFEQWAYEDMDLKKRAKIAAQIRDLPER